MSSKISAILLSGTVLATNKGKDDSIVIKTDNQKTEQSRIGRTMTSIGNSAKGIGKYTYEKINGLAKSVYNSTDANDATKGANSPQEIRKNHEAADAVEEVTKNLEKLKEALNAPAGKCSQEKKEELQQDVQKLILEYAPKVMDIFKKMEDNLPKEVKDALEKVAAEAKEITSKGGKPAEKELKKWAEDLKKAFESIKKDDATLSEEEQRNIKDMKAILEPLEKLNEDNAVQIVGEVVVIAQNKLPFEKLGELADALGAAADVVPIAKMSMECFKVDLEEAAEKAAKDEKRSGTETTAKKPRIHIQQKLKQGKATKKQRKERPL